MSASLKPCAGCSRHVRITERACPFCGSVSSLTPFESVTELRLVSRLDRSRMVALGAMLSAAGIALGCREAPVADAPPLPPAQTQQEAPSITAPPLASSVTEPTPPPSASAAPPSASAAVPPPAPTHVPPPKPTASARPFAPAAAYGAPPSMNPLPNIEPHKP